jgi:hypothetical protein
MLPTFSSDGTVSLSLQISLETCWWDKVRNSSHSTTSLNHQNKKNQNIRHDLAKLVVNALNDNNIAQLFEDIYP